VEYGEAQTCSGQRFQCTLARYCRPPRIVHPYPFDRVASNPWQDMRGRARFPQGLLGGQIVGRNERLQIPERLLQDTLGAYQLLLMVKDIMLQRGHGCRSRARPYGGFAVSDRTPPRILQTRVRAKPGWNFKRACRNYSAGNISRSNLGIVAAQ